MCFPIPREGCISFPIPLWPSSMSWHVLSNSHTQWWKYLLVRTIDILSITYCFTMCNGCFLGSNMPYIQWISAIRVWTVTDISVDIYTIINSLHGVVNVASGLRRSDNHGELVTLNHLLTSIVWLIILRNVICKPIRRDSIDGYCVSSMASSWRVINRE